MRLVILLLGWTTTLTYSQMIGTQSAPELTDAGRALIYEFEVGGVGHLPNHGHPEWPGFASGITVGVGYDCGYNSHAVILSDWQKLDAAAKLAATSGFTGPRAKPLLGNVKDITVTWPLASEVFDNTTLTKFYGMAARAFPKMTELRPNAQAALVSLVFNRGDSLTGPRRAEMREIRSLVPKKDYQGIADAIRAMKRLWRGTDIQAGMYRRRDAEAALVLMP